MLHRDKGRCILSGGKNDRNKKGDKRVSVLLLLHVLMF